MFRFVLTTLLLVGLCSVVMADNNVGVATVASETASVISLNSSNWEFSTLALTTPIVRGMGGSFSYKFLGTTNYSIWADAGAIKYEDSIDPFIGFSTDMPFGGELLEENTRIGIWYLLKSDELATGIRIPF